MSQSPNVAPKTFPLVVHDPLHAAGIENYDSAVRAAMDAGSLSEANRLRDERIAKARVWGGVIERATRRDYTWNGHAVNTRIWEAGNSIAETERNLEDFATWLEGNEPDEVDEFDAYFYRMELKSDPEQRMPAMFIQSKEAVLADNEFRAWRNKQGQAGKEADDKVGWHEYLRFLASRPTKVTNPAEGIVDGESAPVDTYTNRLLNFLQWDDYATKNIAEQMRPEIEATIHQFADNVPTLVEEGILHPSVLDKIDGLRQTKIVVGSLAATVMRGNKGIYNLDFPDSITIKPWANAHTVRHEATHKELCHNLPAPSDFDEAATDMIAYLAGLRTAEERRAYLADPAKYSESLSYGEAITMTAALVHASGGSVPGFLRFATYDSAHTVSVKEHEDLETSVMRGGNVKERLDVIEAAILERSSQIYTSLRGEDPSLSPEITRQLARQEAQQNLTNFLQKYGSSGVEDYIDAVRSISQQHHLEARRVAG